MNIDELKNTSQFKLLTAQESVWVDEYLTNGGDVDKATEKAFNTTSLQSTKAYGRRVLQRPQVGDVINLFNGETTPEMAQKELETQLWNVVRTSKSDASKVAAARLLAEMKGWSKKGGTPADEPSSLEGLD
jgi:hypothetical protein